MSSCAGTVVHIESGIYRSAFHKLRGHLCNLGRFGMALSKKDLARASRLSLLAEVLIELDDAMASVRSLMELEAQVK